MVNYSQNDVRIILGGNDLFCDTASISYSPSISPNYTVNSKNSTDFRASAPPRGSLRVSYYLTGSDPLALRIHDESQPTSLNFNSLTVNSGYLSSYSLSFTPHNSIKVNASFEFYEKIAGTFATSQQPLDDTPPLNTSDVALENGSLVVSDNILDLNYSYSTTFSPIYAVEENFDEAGVNVLGVGGNQKKVSASFRLYDYDLSLPVAGTSESFKINLKDKNNNSVQSYYIDGKVSSKSFDANAGSTPSSNYEILQASLGGETPTVSGITPSVTGVGSTIMVSGENLVDVDHGYIGEYECELSGTPTYNASTQLYEVDLVVPSEMLSGYIAPVKVITKAGEALGTGALAPSSVFTCNSGLVSF